MKEYQMTDEQFERILSASKPVPYIVIGGVPPRSPQEIANTVWEALGEELGFQFMTVKPSEQGDKFFWAEPKE